MTNSSSVSWVYGLGAALPVGAASVLAVLAIVLLNGGPSLVTILTITAVVLMLVTALVDSLGLHVVIRVVLQALILGAAMGYLYVRGDVYAPQAAMSVAGGLVVLFVAGFASGAADTSEAGRVPAAVALLGAVFMAFAGVRLPNEGVLLMSVIAGIAALLLIWRPLPFSGAVFGSFGWALGFYAWLANASEVTVFAPLLIPLLDVAWTLVRRLVTKASRSELSGRGSWWTTLNAWTLPGTDMLAQRLAGKATLRTASALVVGASALCMVIAAVGWLFLLGDKLTLIPLTLVVVGYVALVARRLRPTPTSHPAA